MNGVDADQMALETIRWETGPHERRSKVLKIKLAQVGLSGSSPLRSDSSHDGQVGRWTALTVANNAQGESWKTTLGSQNLIENRHSDRQKRRGNLHFLMVR